MIADHSLVCTYCDELVTCHSTHDGYSGRCSCSTYFFEVGSGEKPVFWERFNNTRKLNKFRVTGDDWSVELDGMRNETATCTVCGDSEPNGDDAVTVSFETVTMGGDPLVKATFECDTEHKHYSNPITEHTYYYPDEKGDFLPEELRSKNS